ncbi:hypothetical protein SADUNF_Sadunf02G0092700 [Salix dunnii]|uniref:Alpha-glucan water dikinase phosphohistidine-like domain-containing protein n=1 Tax=Salix dunnii TaxID=1413687 RepID=A0A835N767_9ROSI|nr:hypothetical protein SADUNF_Sadunf02G0092700 [Salix dunnii]
MASGLTKEKIASYCHPIVSEPRFRIDAREGFTRDLNMHLKTLKVCFATCFEQNIVQNLKLKEGKAISITVKSMNLIISFGLQMVSCRKDNLNHENLCMALLIQEVICGDYTFAIHTKNPLSGIPVR